MRKTAEVLKPILGAYFRPEVRGLEHIPDEPSMLVGNHDGGYIPVDGICLGIAWHERYDFRRPLVWLMHDFPFRISSSLTRYLSLHGVQPASRQSLRRAFDRNLSVFVYPGGAHEAFRPYSKRREVELGHRTGFVAEALARRVPIVPIVSAGCHETLFVLARGSWLARKFPLVKKFRSDVLPLWIGLPWGIGFGPLPHIPLPSKIEVQVLPPIRLWEHLGDRANTGDPAVLHAGLDLVRGRMQMAMTSLYAHRRFPIIG
jgi:1-acyl-sn-glycerol-3-phosphate acyltransferase